MFWTKVKRVIKSGWVAFWRNGYVSLASVLVMTVALLVISAIIYSDALLNSTLQNIKNKVDINVYFVTDAPEDQILTLQQQLNAQPEVASTTYISSDQALAAFKDRHATDQYTLQALSELDSNPLGAILNIQAKDPSQYEGIVQYLNTEDTSVASGTTPIIDKINYDQNKTAIDALNRIIAASRTLGLVLAIFFALIAILITFNTIRLAIYISRDEISVMRLVGASNKYIRGPFVVEGLLYGLSSALITIILLYPASYWLGPISDNLGTGINLFDYYLQNFFQLLVILLVSGLVIGAISSYLAVKKYLKI